MANEWESELTHKFWEAFNKSPFVMIGVDEVPQTSVPMTAQLDKDANSAIWFFARRDADLAKLGAATAHFSGKDHHVFARFTGTLVEETDHAILDRFWGNAIKAWFPGGKDDPSLIFIRMDLGHASIWDGDLGIGNTLTMILGGNLRDNSGKHHLETSL